MIDLEKAFAELAPPSPDAQDAEAARRIWLRACVASITEPKGRLRFASVTLFLAALDAIAVLLVAVAVHA
ncbi:MAG TPA: hypothetical protein VH087_14695 [Thermoanaerobaculia bacterium]|jgi:hypothetical protein|nr:hypothetical protein [Thermoanaerobaculia bacterium]